MNDGNKKNNLRFKMTTKNNLFPYFIKLIKAFIQQLSV